jgi:hypothetical protein
MQDYSEKRDFYRMAIDCSARYRVIDGGSVQNAVVKDLSAGGLHLRTESAVDADATLNVEIRPIKDITPPLHAVVKVIRCSAAEDEKGGYAVACSIERMLPVEEVGPDFP